MGLFGPKKATEKTYIEFEKQLYIDLEILKKTYQEAESEDDKYYLISSADRVYKKPFDLCYGLVKFYTKNLEGNTSFKFKRNFLLSKTRGLFSAQKTETSKIVADIYYVKKEQLDNLPEEYFRMFKLEKYFETVTEEEPGDKKN